MRRTTLIIVGSVLVAAGLAMLVLPGPGMVVILVGLAVLASAGVLWAARLLVKTRERLPTSDDDASAPGLVDTTVDRIDRAMDSLDAVKQVRREARRAREAAHREDLVTTDRHQVEGQSAAEELRARQIADADVDHRIA